MALSERELKEINRHCTCGKPNFIFIKYYKWRGNNEKWLRSAGVFRFCNDPSCTFYFKTFIKLDFIYENKLTSDECYYMSTGFTLENLPEIW